MSPDPDLKRMSDSLRGLGRHNHNQDSGLKIHVLQLVRDTATPDADELSLDQCIVEIGIERLRESLRQSRFRLKNN